jgi:hypothetical protein
VGEVKSGQDWEERARELTKAPPEGWLRTDERLVKAALQLGREMADARADLIAKGCDGMAKNCTRPADICAWETAAAYASSTIKEPQAASVVQSTQQTEAAIRADERNKVAEEIARKLDERSAYLPGRLMKEEIAFGEAAAIVRSFIAKPDPTSREQVLEEALREIENAPIGKLDGQEAIYQRDIARRALGWTP